MSTIRILSGPIVRLTKGNSRPVFLWCQIKSLLFHKPQAHFMVIGCTSDFHFESRKTSLEIAFDFTLQVFQSFPVHRNLRWHSPVPYLSPAPAACIPAILPLAKQIPKCNINTADGAHHHTFAAVGPVIPHHFLMQILIFVGSSPRINGFNCFSTILSLPPWNHRR